MRISRVSTVERAEIVLWVIAPDRVEALEYPKREVVPELWSSEEAYEQRLEETIRSADSPALAVEYVGRFSALTEQPHASPRELVPDGTMVVTRLRTRMEPADMTRDIAFQSAPGDLQFAASATTNFGPLRVLIGLVLLILAAVLRLFSEHGERFPSLSLALLGLMVLLL